MIAVQAVSKTYGRFGRRVQALDGVALEVARGETLGLIGPNGAGKTTLLSCLLGFLRPDQGTITVDGRAPDDLAVRARTGYLPERLGFDRELPGRAFLAFHWRLAGGDREGAKAGVEAAADRVAFLEGGRVTKTETLRGKSATRRRGMLRVPPTRLAETAGALLGEAFTPRAESDGSIRFVVGSDDDMARAIRAVALAGVPIYEARISAELEELFSPGAGE